MEGQSGDGIRYPFPVGELSQDIGARDAFDLIDIAVLRPWLLERTDFIWI